MSARALPVALALAVAACTRGDDTSEGARGATRGDSATAGAGTATTVAAGAAGAAGAPGQGCSGNRLVTRGDTSVRVIPVNRGTHGMIARTRWLASPDGCALLVVEDPASTEADALPNGALLVSEREGRPLVIPIDSVWDVAPDAAWRTLAIGRGWLLSGGEHDSVPAARWESLARATGIQARELQALAFNASGMAYARGVALTYVQPIAEGARPRLVARGGWRVRWRRDTLFAGGPPQRVNDDAEPSGWTMHTAPDWQSVHVPAGFAPAAAGWVEGPMIELGVEGDSSLKAERAVGLRGGGAAQSRDGGIILLVPGRPGRAIGPGTLLAATLGGRFLVALRPTPNRRASDPAQQLVVYEVP